MYVYYMDFHVCEISIYLAYFASIYIGTSLYYLFRTQAFSDVGTPFYDSLTPEQKEIKSKSSSTRRRVFCQGLAICTIALYLTQPFKVCSK